MTASGDGPTFPTLADAVRTMGAFDLVVIGGGTFGPALVSRLLELRAGTATRVLVLERGRFAVDDHVHNRPWEQCVAMPGPGGTLADDTVGSVWDVPWRSNVSFSGLASCLGGRSVYHGGWCPRPIGSEVVDWPSTTVERLTNQHWPEAQALLGTGNPNDFLWCALHDELKERVLRATQAGAIANVIVPDHADALEAPLALHAPPPNANHHDDRVDDIEMLPSDMRKYTPLPALLRAATKAHDDHHQVAVVVGCQVTGLTVVDRRTTEVRTTEGDVALGAGGMVVLAAGTVESTRLALQSVPDPHGRIGRNLMSHTSTKLTVRVPRTQFSSLPAGLQTGALFVKGRHEKGHFHLQVTATTTTSGDFRSELWAKKIQDLHWLDNHAADNEQYVVIGIQGIAETFGDRESTSTRGITLDESVDEHGRARAFVRMDLTDPEVDLRDAMDVAAVDLAGALAEDGEVEFFHPVDERWQATPPRPFSTAGVHDPIGTSHHEGGTLWMGDDATASVTDDHGRFHTVDNLYATGPALFPTVGSPNPLLTGVALAHLTAEDIARRWAN